MFELLCRCLGLLPAISVEHAACQTHQGLLGLTIGTSQDQAPEVLRWLQSCTHNVHPVPCQRDSAGAHVLLRSVLWRGVLGSLTLSF